MLIEEKTDDIINEILSCGTQWNTVLLVEREPDQHAYGVFQLK